MADDLATNPASPAATEELLPGVLVGHDTDSRRPTGVTVVLLPEGTTAGVAVRGAAPGTRETDLLAPTNTVQTIDAIALCGGSAFGLDAATGVMRWLEAAGRGIPVGPVRVPIVPAAVLFDLFVGDASVRPDAAAGQRACEAAVPIAGAARGSVGAGAGATVGKLLGPAGAMRGGVGIATMGAAGIVMTAIVAVNAMGDVVNPGTGEVVAGARPDPSSAEPVSAVDVLLAQFGGSASVHPGVPNAPPKAEGKPAAAPDEGGGSVSGDSPTRVTSLATRAEGDVASEPNAGDRTGGVGAGATSPGANTTIGVLITDAALTKTQANRLASVAHDGLARTIRPAHTTMDGDTLFVAATGTSSAPVPDMLVLSILAAEVTALAVLDGVRSAEAVRTDALWLPAVADRD